MGVNEAAPARLGEIEYRMGSGEFRGTEKIPAFLAFASVEIPWLIEQAQRAQRMDDAIAQAIALMSDPWAGVGAMREAIAILNAARGR